jgi:hypothetical protein
VEGVLEVTGLRREGVPKNKKKILEILGRQRKTECHNELSLASISLSPSLSITNQGYEVSYQLQLSNEQLED